MRAVFEVLKPDDVEMKMTVAMPLKSWVRIRDALAGGAYHSDKADFVDAIRSLVDQAQVAFTGEKDALK